MDQPQPVAAPSGIQAKEIADNIMVQADHYKATVHKPEGMYAPLTNHGQNHVLEGNNYVPQIANMVNSNSVLINVEGIRFEDDEFFHLTCHIESSMRVKIERGKFIELEKLMPKTRSFTQCFSEENKMKLVNREGSSYWVPEKIGSLKKWDQAFRIYAAIYSRANPIRAYEIWQYIHVITTAANSFAGRMSWNMTILSDN